LKKVRLLIYIMRVSAVSPLSMDMYMPALPAMVAEFRTTESALSMTLTVYFVCVSVATIIFGTLSDKFGRKPMLFTGLAFFTAGSVLCAVAPSVGALTAVRVIQAIGCGAEFALGSAIVRDRFKGREQEHFLALVATFTMIAPVVAPVLGALLLKVTDWRGLFWLQAALGAVAFLMTVFFKESLREKGEGNIAKTFGRIAFVLRSRHFAPLLIGFNLTPIALMGYIAVSPYVYQDYFGVSSQTYSLFYAAVAIFNSAAPLSYIWFTRRVSRFGIVSGCYMAILVGGALMCVLGEKNLWLFTVLLVLPIVGTSLVRPPQTYAILNLNKGDTGSANALYTATGNFLGSIGVSVASLFAADQFVFVSGFLFAVTGGASMLIWLFGFRAHRAELYPDTEMPNKNT
jgi:DHA1 family bicyclomycin/chloramphenicol resistance-like MFS transporter